ncbi:MAG TPA: serine/threonine-protein kinase, partial [Herpetosiphonaceae bacterium]
MRLESLIGTQLGRYAVTKLLGRGGMAAVFQADDSVLRRAVALKILYSQFLSDASLVERFRSEAIIAARLEHPNIVPIYDVGEAEGLVYIAMKLLPGRSLQDELQMEHAPLSTERVIELVTQLGAALDYAHARGVVHRDIKPGNVMVLDSGQVVLNDFGIAKSLDAPGMTGTGVLIGTPDYMAPEQINPKQGPLDGRADIYSLGVMTYRMLTGERPFDGSTTEVMMAHLSQEPPAASARNPRLSPALDAVLGRAMAKRPEDRYQSAGGFARALGEAAGASTAVGEATPPPGARRS